MSSKHLEEKAKLIALLREAADLEHKFLCQYLYAAFSLKKHPDASCNAAQLEHVRRWASMLYRLSRQEMEHLSIVNSVLTAIGAQPCFTHENFPCYSHHYDTKAMREHLGAALHADEQPCDLPFVLEPLSRRAVQRFACMESPRLANVPPSAGPLTRLWCLKDAEGNCGCVAPHGRHDRVLEAAWDEHQKQQNVLELQTLTHDREVQLGTIEALYGGIRKALQDLHHQLGSEALFDGRLSGQGEIPSEYDIYLFPIRDLPAALAGIDLITKQGEGSGAKPGYESHFLQLVEIAEAYATLHAGDERFQPAKALLANPTLDRITVEPTKLAVELLDYGYVTMLHMLTAYYAHYDEHTYRKAPYLAAALSQTAFAPLMTMLFRALGEVVTELPVGTDENCGQAATTAGPTFDIPEDDRQLLNAPGNTRYTTLAFFEDRLAKIVEGLEVLKEMPLDNLASRAQFEATSRPSLRSRVDYCWQTMTRAKGNLRYIYDNYIFCNFRRDPCKEQDVQVSQVEDPTLR